MLSSQSPEAVVKTLWFVIIKPDGQRRDTISAYIVRISPLLLPKKQKTSSPPESYSPLPVYLRKIFLKKTELRVERRELRGGCKDFMVCNL